VPKPANVFGLDDEDDEEDVEAQIARQAERKRSATKVPTVCACWLSFALHAQPVQLCMHTHRLQVQQMYEAALAEDPNVFNYDEV
jgi:coiled-coil domain-containing protein 55